MLFTLRRVAPIVLITAIVALLLIEARHVHLRQIQQTMAASSAPGSGPSHL